MLLKDSFAQFRHRGYKHEPQLPECPKNQIQQFGDGEDFVVCPKCGNTGLVKKWDKLVTTETTAVDFAPVPVEEV